MYFSEPGETVASSPELRRGLHQLLIAMFVSLRPLSRCASPGSRTGAIRGLLVRSRLSAIDAG